VTAKRKGSVYRRGNTCGIEKGEKCQFALVREERKGPVFHCPGSLKKHVGDGGGFSIKSRRSSDTLLDNDVGRITHGNFPSPETGARVLQNEKD